MGQSFGGETHDRFLLIRRILYSIPVLLGVAFITLWLFHIAGGDPVAIKLGKNPSPAEVEALRLELGLHDSFFLQYTTFIKQLLVLDFGISGRTIRRYVKSSVGGSSRP